MTLHLKAGEVRNSAGVDLHRLTFSTIRFTLVAS